MFTDYRKTTKLPNLINAGINEDGLVTCGQWTATGAPTTEANFFNPTCFIQNIVDSVLYYNSGNTASPAWIALTPENEIITQIITLTPDEVQNLGDTPVEIIPTPGEGNAIVVFNGLAFIEFGTVPYNFANGTLEIITQGANKQYLGTSGQTFLNSLITKGTMLTQQAVGTLDQTQLILNAPLLMQYSNGNATQGDGIVKIILNYSIASL